MLINQEDLAKLWNDLSSNCGEACSIKIFVANNCDALAAYKILTDLLVESSISFSCKPVFSYTDIYEGIKKEAIPEEINSLVFLNCGAKIDFTEQWFYQGESDIKTYIFDSARPILHNNVLTTKGVYVVDFGDIKIENCPEDKDIQAFNNQEGEGDQETIVDGAKEYEKIISGSKDKEQSQEESKEETKGYGLDDSFDIDQIGKKRRRNEDTKEEDRNNRRRRYEEYYSGDYFTNCCSYFTYCLGVHLSKQSVEFFWLWILGLTDQFIHSKICYEEYLQEYEKCKKDFLLISDKNFDQDKNLHSFNQEEAEGGLKFDNKGYFYKNVDLETENFKVGSIIPSQEFRFAFLRSWSLYEAIKNSEYVAIKLKLWQDAGKSELTRFLMTLGIPEFEYTQQYKFMTPKYKQMLKTKIPEVGPKFGLDDLLFSSFVRQINNKAQMNASDMVYVVTSLLESPKPVMIDNIPGEGNLEEIHQHLEAFDPENFTMKDFRENQVENFWSAYESLNIKNFDLISCGVNMSKEYQKSLISLGSSIIINKIVKPCTYFRYAIIKNDILAEVKLFHHPMAIQKLALFVMEAYLETRKIKDPKPIILAVKNTMKDVYLTAGVLGRQNTYIKSRNDFGDQFRDAAEKIASNFNHDGFDASLIEIKSSDFDEFLDELLQI
ncbi:unnamed protein product [Moneuplotes crassus]|uniref:Uncharacterized protein n=1 Tax=Euplotes crassus TaxID=5936 RepID=A0AAD1U2T2_EUPCR|nr:unnamed protein product [Moneuplotes crassus]